MRFPTSGHRFMKFSPPYRTLSVIEHPFQIGSSPFPDRGSALLWNVGKGGVGAGLQLARTRPPGMALMILLPRGAESGSRQTLDRLMKYSRPHSVLPYLEEVDPEELAAVLRRFPADFEVEVSDYLVWRGIDVDSDTRRLLRRTLELSGEIRTVTALARALYMSRRALGRRFLTRGLPVPSHWLHFGRVLRGSIRLQSPGTTLFGVANDLGYPDGFAFSNQLKRLTGLRPSVMKDCYGWEWLVESWLIREAGSGHLSPQLITRLFPSAVKIPVAPESGATRESVSSGSPLALRVAETVTGEAPAGRG